MGVKGLPILELLGHLLKRLVSESETLGSGVKKGSTPVVLLEAKGQEALVDDLKGPFYPKILRVCEFSKSQVASARSTRQ